MITLFSYWFYWAALIQEWTSKFTKWTMGQMVNQAGSFVWSNQHIVHWSFVSCSKLTKRFELCCVTTAVASSMKLLSVYLCKMLCRKKIIRNVECVEHFCHNYIANILNRAVAHDQDEGFTTLFWKPNICSILPRKICCLF